MIVSENAIINRVNLLSLGDPLLNCLGDLSRLISEAQVPIPLMGRRYCLRGEGTVSLLTLAEKLTEQAQVVRWITI